MLRIYHAFAICSRKDSYKLDWCYEQHESVDDIFVQEVKPLVPKIFLGLDTSVIEFGTRCTEKPPLTKVCIICYFVIIIIGFFLCVC